MFKKVCVKVMPGRHNDLNINTLVVSLPGAWRYRVRARTG